MQSDFVTTTIPLLVLLGMIDTLMIYGAYLALSVWRGLAIPIFRSRALWMALFGIPLVVAINYSAITRVIISDNSALSASVISETLFSFPLDTLFVWIDRMVSSVIRLDYLRRDVLYWRRLRVVYWALVVVANVLFFSRYVYGTILGVVSTVLLLVPLAYGTMALVKGARTLRDTTFKSHLKWLSYFGAAIIPALLTYGLYGVSIPIPQHLLILALSFCFYKMARYLVPIGKISAE